MRRKIGTAFKLDEQKILPKGEVGSKFLLQEHFIRLSNPAADYTDQKSDKFSTTAMHMLGSVLQELKCHEQGKGDCFFHEGAQERL